MNIIDIAIIFLLLFSGLIGWKKGVIKELVALVGIIVVFVLAYVLKNYIGDWCCKYLPFFNFSGSLEGLTALNIVIYQLAAFFILCSVFMGIYCFIVHISGWIQKLVNATIILRLPSKLAGFAVGLVEGYILLFIILLLTAIPLSRVDFFYESNLANYMLYKTPVLSTGTESITSSVNEVTTLINDVADKKISTNNANLKIIDISLNYKVTTKHVIEQLVVLDRLKGITGLDKVLANY